LPIRLLDEHTAEKIAAGEVIENPASVVKELVENSLDAGATVIEIHVEGGGKESITVSDNGEGIPGEEVPLAFQRFATSKLTKIDDLQAIASLGFRGEALPSIAAVARVSMTTRVKESLSATRIELAGGKVIKCEEAGGPQGTSVQVKDLFYNTPGRLKFLQHASVEQGRIVALTTNLALANPGVAFTLSSEKRVLLQTSGDGNLLHTIASLWGEACAAAMLPLQGGSEDNRTKVEGFISAPHFHRASRRTHQVFIVNGRLVQSPLLSSALERGYGTLLPRGRHPVAVINLSLEPSLLDVNVHPAKTEIRFLRSEQVKDMVYRTVRNALHNSYTFAPAPSRAAEAGTGKQLELDRRHGLIWREVEELPFAPGGQGEEPLEHPGYFPGAEGREGEAGAVPLREAGTEPGREHLPGPSRESLSGPSQDIVADPSRESIWEPSPEPLRLLGQYLQSYLVVQQGEDLLLIDQHAAHERIIFEKLSSENSSSAGGGQLTLPITVEVPPAWRERLHQLLPLLEEIGFKMEPFGDNTFIVRQVPFNEWHPINREELYLLIGDLSAFEEEKMADRREHIRKTIACHRAIKAHQALSRAEMEALLQQWSETPRAHYCPHGRPAVIRFRRGELEKSFRRRGG
jgi:DNA mismatch repair protein MutL